MTERQRQAAFESRKAEVLGIIETMTFKGLKDLVDSEGIEKEIESYEDGVGAMENEEQLRTFLMDVWDEFDDDQIAYLRTFEQK